MQTHTFSMYEFSSEEIDQICTLVARWSGGDIQPLRVRGVSKQVLAYAERMGMLERCTHKGHERLKFTGSSRFNVVHDLPVEALWRIVEPMLGKGQSVGRSIARDARWAILNIYPERHRNSTDATVQEQLDVLGRLAQYGYILLQTAGSIWNIERWRNGRAA